MMRRMILPYVFGSNTGYQWTPEDNPGGTVIREPHHDYCSLYNEYSVRLWEPDRPRFSDFGMNGQYAVGSGQDEFLAPPRPMNVEIHGIKGNLYFRFDGTPQAVGLWYDDNGEELEFQPGWFDTYAALSGTPLMGQDYGNFDSTTARLDGTWDMNPAVHIPVFKALYRGRYRAIDDLAGWEIDSGPADDPDTLLSVDITNPTQLETPRIHWWDMDMVKAPSLRTSRYVEVKGEQVGDAYLLSGFAQDPPGAGSMHRYPLNLSENHKVRSDQVLWLSVQTGTIRLPVLRPGAAGGSGPTLQCSLYHGHKFSVSVTASALVTQREAK